MTPMQLLRPALFLLLATVLEVSGDAAIRKGIFEFAGWPRFGLFAAGTVLLLGYGTSVNLAPLEFGQVVGLYVAILFVVWQIINFAVFRVVPTAPILIGGALIIAGGVTVSFWKAA
jgi:hypothetical protein